MKADEKTRHALLRWTAMAAALMIVSGWLALGASVTEASGQPPAQDEFVPMESVPPEDQLPAAPLLVAAYALLWMFVVGYLWSIWRRMATVERELVDLSQRTGGS